MHMLTTLACFVAVHVLKNTLQPGYSRLNTTHTHTHTYAHKSTHVCTCTRLQSSLALWLCTCSRTLCNQGTTGKTHTHTHTFKLLLALRLCRCSRSLCSRGRGRQETPSPRAWLRCLERARHLPRLWAELGWLLARDNDVVWQLAVKLIVSLAVARFDWWLTLQVCKLCKLRVHRLLWAELDWLLARDHAMRW